MRIFDLIYKVATGLIVIAVTWLVGELDDLRSKTLEHNSRIAIIESSLYTAKDAMNLERQINAKFNNLTHQFDLLEGNLKVIQTILERLEAKIVPAEK